MAKPPPFPPPSPQHPVPLYLKFLMKTSDYLLSPLTLLQLLFNGRGGALPPPASPPCPAPPLSSPENPVTACFPPNATYLSHTLRARGRWQSPSTPLTKRGLNHEAGRSRATACCCLDSSACTHSRAHTYNLCLGLNSFSSCIFTSLSCFNLCTSPPPHTIFACMPTGHIPPPPRAPHTHAVVPLLPVIALCTLLMPCVCHASCHIFADATHRVTSLTCSQSVTSVLVTPLPVPVTTAPLECYTPSLPYNGPRPFSPVLPVSTLQPPGDVSLELSLHGRGGFANTPPLPPPPPNFLALDAVSHTVCTLSCSAVQMNYYN